MDHQFRNEEFFKKYDKLRQEEYRSKKYVDGPRFIRSYEEEIAGELTPYDSFNSSDERGSGLIAGTVALFLAVISLFFFTYLFAIGAILFGIYGYSKGSKIIGVTSILISIISMLYLITVHHTLF